MIAVWRIASANSGLMHWPDAVRPSGQAPCAWAATETSDTLMANNAAVATRVMCSLLKRDSRLLLCRSTRPEGSNAVLVRHIDARGNHPAAARYDRHRRARHERIG